MNTQMCLRENLNEKTRLRQHTNYNEYLYSTYVFVGETVMILMENIARIVQLDHENS